MKLGFLGLLAVLALVPACSSKSDAEPSTEVGKEEQASVEVSAAEGGEVTIGKASLEIPGGALAEDTTITVETSNPSNSLPDASSLKGMLYDFGPDGTAFSAPAALTLPSVGTVGEGKEAVIAWLDEETDAWQDLPTTVAKDGSLQAEISHFTTFVVRLRGVETTGDACNFSACGGDITGTWTLSGVCADVPDGVGPVDCPDATVDVNFNATGSITFNDDGTYDKDFVNTTTITIEMPNSCLKMLGGGTAPESCAAIADGEVDEDGKSTTCTGDPATKCTCVETSPQDIDAATGTWEAGAQGAISMADDGEDPDSQLYCVTGNKLQVQQTSDDGVTITWMGTR